MSRPGSPTGKQFAAGTGGSSHWHGTADGGRDGMVDQLWRKGSYQSRQSESMDEHDGRESAGDNQGCKLGQD